MRFGSHKVPMRVMIAVISLAGLGVAATIPTEADEMVDPIITESISKVDGGEPTLTDLPPQVDVAPTAANEMVEGAEQAPRQILPQSSDAVTMPEPVPVELAASPSASTSSSDAIVTPVMSDVQSQPMQEVSIGQSVDMVAGIQPVAGNATSSNGAIILALDHARVMRMVGAVATVIIGNPSIADVAMPDPQTVVLTGKSYGETNMVMLDDAGNILAEQLLRVTVRGQSLVSVYRGVQRTTLTCSPTCEIRPTPGDAPDLVQAGLSAFQARNAAAVEAANSQ